MDVDFFLQKRLTFIEAFYDDASATFHETKRKIEANEPPYVDERNPEDYAGCPAFLEEWQYADECIENLGRFAVQLLSNAFKGYLSEFMKDMGHWYDRADCRFANYKNLLESGKKSGGWLQQYRRLFLELYEN